MRTLYIFGVIVATVQAFTAGNTKVWICVYGFASWLYVGCRWVGEQI